MPFNLTPTHRYRLIVGNTRRKKILGVHFICACAIKKQSINDLECNRRRDPQKFDAIYIQYIIDNNILIYFIKADLMLYTFDAIVSYIMMT